MPLYGDPLVYGYPTLYGSESEPLRFALEVDWQGNGYFSGASEWINLNSISVERGRKYFINTNGNGFAQAQVGTMDVKIDDKINRYNPYNSLSNLYPYVRPKQIYRLRALYDTTVYNLIAGRVNNVTPIGGNRNDVRIAGTDGWEILQREISILLQEGQTSDALINIILNDASWEWGRDIGLGAATLGYWWAEQQSAKDALHSLVSAELGKLNILADGTISFRSRHDVPATVTTITGADIDRDTDYSIALPWEVVRNRIEISAFPQVLQSQSVLWDTTENTLITSNGGKKSIFVNYLYNNEEVPAKNVLSIPVGSDFIVNSQSDGLGTDITGYCTMRVYPFSKRAKVEWVNNHPSIDGYIISSKVKGQAITTPYNQSLSAENAASQKAFGVLDFRLSEYWLQDTVAAQNFADYYSYLLGNPKPYFECWLLPNLPLQLGMDLGKRYDLNIPELGIVGKYNVVWLGQYWNIEDGLNLKTRVMFEPAADIGGTTFMMFPYQFEVNSDFAL